MGKITPVKKLSSKAVGLKHGYRSGLEEDVAATLKVLSIPFFYEKLKIAYLEPAVFHTYMPDFLLLENGIIVETKGRFLPDDRKKHLLIKGQFPWLDIRFVFSSVNAKISKQSNTTYGKWCEKNGFKYAKKSIPAEWLLEDEKPYLSILKKLIEEGKKLEPGHYNGNTVTKST